jgi:two-component system, sensor histidine kinase and response regulator
MLNKIKKLFFWQETVLMEKWVFNATLGIISIYTFFLGIHNLVLGQLPTAYMAFIIIPPIWGIWYLLRVKQRYLLALYVFGGLTYPVLVLSFLLKDGNYGPTIYLFFLMQLVLVSISPVRLAILWTLINVVVFIELFYFGLYNEEWVSNHYDDKFIEFVDHAFIYLASILGLTFLVITLKKFYAVQKKDAASKSRELALVNRELTYANLQKDKIIAIISHDLKNPLLSILQSLELINTYDDFSKEEISYLHEELYHSTKRTHRLLEDILEWSTLELKNKASKVKSIDLKSLFSDTFGIMHTIARQKGLELQVEYLSNPEIQIETDRLLLILRNLIQNSIKFTKEGGMVKVTISQNEIEALIEVKDTGIGIPPDKIKQLFELEVKPTFGTANEKGTGMGLYLCYQNANKLGGKLEVESTLGKGTTFSLAVPLNYEIPPPY